MALSDIVRHIESAVRQADMRRVVADAVLAGAFGAGLGRKDGPYGLSGKSLYAVAAAAGIGAVALSSLDWKSYSDLPIDQTRTAADLAVYFATGALAFASAYKFGQSKLSR